MFLNKLDRAGASFHSSVLSLLAHRLHPKPMVLTLPIASFDPNDYALAMMKALTTHLQNDFIGGMAGSTLLRKAKAAYILL